VNSTFSQALDLYKQGRTDEVVAGCNLILQMDPLFDPAKRLLEKAKNPLSPVDIDSLTAGASATPALADARSAMAARDFERDGQGQIGCIENDARSERRVALVQRHLRRVDRAEELHRILKLE